MYLRLVQPVLVQHNKHVNLDATPSKCRDLVSVFNVSVSRRSRDVFWNVSSRLGLEGSTSRSHLGIEDITSRSRCRDFSLAMHLSCGYITKKIMDLTHKKQVVE